MQNSCNFLDSTPTLDPPPSRVRKQKKIPSHLKGKGEAAKSEAPLRAAERVHREMHTGLPAEQGQRSVEGMGV